VRKLREELSAVEAARQAGIRLYVLYPLLRVGRIPGHLENGRWRVSAEGLRQYIQERTKRGGQHGR